MILMAEQVETYVSCRSCDTQYAVEIIPQVGDPRTGDFEPSMIRSFGCPVCGCDEYEVVA